LSGLLLVSACASPRDDAPPRGTKAGSNGLIAPTDDSFLKIFPASQAVRIGDAIVVDGDSYHLAPTGGFIVVEVVASSDGRYLLLRYRAQERR